VSLFTIAAGTGAVQAAMQDIQTAYRFALSTHPILPP
jgi:hypothetical protein